MRKGKKPTKSEIQDWVKCFLRVRKSETSENNAFEKVAERTGWDPRTIKKYVPGALRARGIDIIDAPLQTVSVNDVPYEGVRVPLGIDQVPRAWFTYSFMGTPYRLVVADVGRGFATVRTLNDGGSEASGFVHFLF